MEKTPLIWTLQKLWDLKQMATMSSEEGIGLIKTFSNSVIYRNIFSKFSLQKISWTLRFSKNIQIWLQMTLAKLCLLTQTVNLPCWDPARELWEEELLSIHSIVVANTRKKKPLLLKIIKLSYFFSKLSHELMMHRLHNCSVL